MAGRRKDANTLLNPTLLVEVLFEGTEACDRSAKFAHDCSIASLRAYLIVSLVDRTLELVERNADGSWTISGPMGPGEAVSVRALGIELPADEVVEDGDLAKRGVFTGLEVLQAVGPVAALNRLQ